MSRTNNPNLNNINADTQVEVNVRYTEFNNINNGGVIDDANPRARLYLSENGEARLTQGNFLMQQAAQLYDFKKGEWTSTGERLVPDENDRTTLLNVTKIELQNEIARRKKTNPNQKDVNIGADKITNAGVEEDNLGNDNNGDKTGEDTNTDGTPIEFPEFGLVDDILQTLSLRNLKYPIDADYGNTQDYMQINQFTYKAPQNKLFFGDRTEKRKGGYDPSDITNNGVPTGTPLEKAIGLVKLPMPNSLADSNNVSWGPDQLNALTAAVASGVMGKSGEAVTAVTDFLKGMGGRNFGQNLTEATRALTSGVGGAFNDVKGEGSEMVKQVLESGSNLNVLGRSVVGSAVLNFLQFQVSPESILARGSGVIPNNNLALLFNSPTLREFTFSWKMSPRSREEAIRVNNILRFFKQGMAPKKSEGTKSGGGSFFLGTPNIFDIHFKTAREKGSGYNQLFDRNDSVLRIKTCACTGAAVNYTPEGMWNAYEEGQPVAITLTLRFSELEPIFDTDYDNNYFNFDPQRTDLLPVPTDAVGY